MRRLLQFFKKTALVLFVLLSPVGLGETLTDLHEMLKEADSFEQFLENSDLKERFYTELNNYYGNRLSRRDYDVILGKCKTLAEKIPGFSQKIWKELSEGERAPTFEIETSVKTAGRNVNVPLFAQYMADWKKDLSSNVAKHFKQQGEDLPKAVDAELKRLGEALDKISERQLKQLQGAKSRNARKKIEAEAGKDRGALVYTDAARAAVSYALLSHLDQERVADALNTGDADLMLEEFRRMRLQPNTVSEENTHAVSSGLDNVLRALIPKTEDIIDTKAYLEMKHKLTEQNQRAFPIPEDAPPAEAQRLRQRRNEAKKAAFEKFNENRLFPIAFDVDPTTRAVVEAGSGGAASFHFESPARKFLGLFDGRWLGECVGANCERFAVGALDGVQKQHVRRGNSFLGFIQLVPGILEVQDPETKKETSDGKVYAAVEFGASVLREQAVTEDAETGDRRSTPLVELWLEKFKAKQPKKWTDLIMGESSSINNAGVQSSARGSLAYKLQSPIGEGKQFRHLDPMAALIRSVAEDLGEGNSYTDGRLVTEATVPGAGKLRPLRPLTEAQVEQMALAGGASDKSLADVLDNPQWVKHPRAASWMNGLVERGIVDTEVLQLLQQPSWLGKRQADAWVETILKRGAADEKILELLRVDMWAQNPKATQWVSEILPRGASDGDLIGKLIKSPLWKDHPSVLGWISQALERGKVDAAIASEVLLNSNFQKHPIVDEWMTKLVQRGGAAVNDVLINRALKQEYWERHPRAAEWIDELVQHGNNHQSFAERLLKSDYWKDHPSVSGWLKKIASGKDRNAQTAIAEALKTPAWANHPKAVEIARSLMNGDYAGILSVLTHPLWEKKPERGALVVESLAAKDAWRGSTKVGDDWVPYKDAYRSLLEGDIDLRFIDSERAHSLGVAVFEDSQPISHHSIGDQGEVLLDFIIKHAPTHPPFLNALYSLALSPQHNRHEKAMDAFLAWGEKPENTKLAFQNLGTFLVQNAHIARRDGADMLNEDMLHLAQWAKEGSEPPRRNKSGRDFMDAIWQSENYYESAEKILDFFDRHDERVFAEAPEALLIAFVGLQGVLNIAPDTRVSYELKKGSLGLIGAMMGQGLPVSEEKFKLTRRARDRIAEYSMLSPALAELGMEAMKDLIEAGFYDDNKTRDAAMRIVDQFPEVALKLPGELEEKVNLRLEAASSDTAKAQAAAAKIVAPAPHLFLQTMQDSVRIQAALQVVTNDLARGHSKIEGTRSEMVRNYAKKRPEEFDALCGHLLKALADVD